MLLLLRSFPTDRHARFFQHTPNNCYLIMRRNEKKKGMKNSSCLSPGADEQRKLASQATNTTSSLLVAPITDGGIAAIRPVGRRISESSATTTSYSTTMAPSASNRYSNISGEDYTNFWKKEEDSDHAVSSLAADVAENACVANKKMTTTSSEILCLTKKTKTDQVQNRTTFQDYCQHAGLLGNDREVTTSTATQKVHDGTSNGVKVSGDQCLYQRSIIETADPSTLRAGPLVHHINPAATNFQNAPSNITPPSLAAQDFFGLSVNTFFDVPVNDILEPRPIEEMMHRQDNDNGSGVGRFVQLCQSMTAIRSAAMAVN
jgi:hypothetical protein